MGGPVSALRRTTLLLIVAVGFGVTPLGVTAQNQSPIPASAAFNYPGCNNQQLEGVNLLVTEVQSPYRADPEWNVIVLDSNLFAYLQPPTILEGFVAPTPINETSTSQAPAEVAEEDLSWTHYTHDFTVNVVPDPPYQHLLSSWVRDPGGPYSTPEQRSPDQTGCPPNFTLMPAPGDPNPNDGICIGCPEGEFLAAQGCTADSPEFCPDGSTGVLCLHTDMEVEWDNAALMDEREGFARDWGAVPEFVWPGVGDRVWVEGRWIFDCGHPGLNGTSANVKFSTEIHPPRAMATFRYNHPALDSFPVPRVSAPNFPYPQSYLPVTGEPVAGQPGPTNVPVTEADIYVSGLGGAANDVCTIVPSPCSNFGGHSGVVLPVNDRNYVFDIYPPGTNFNKTTENGNFVVTPPVPIASLQWRLVDHSSELPAHACGGNDTSVCNTVQPIFCLLDDSTPPIPQDQSNVPAQCPVPQPPVISAALATTSVGPPGGLPCIAINCAQPPAHPTRLRVILPFQGAAANFFAKSILLGWDDVPTGPITVNNNPGISALAENLGTGGNQVTGTPLVRTFQVRLHNFTILYAGESLDWRIFVNVGGQWRYMSRVFDTDANGNNVCQENSALEIFGPVCFQFDNTPWTVSVQDGSPIHVGVGGFIANGVENSNRAVFMCRTYPAGCDSPTNFGVLDQPFFDLAFYNDERIGTYEFDLVGPKYSPPAPFATQKFDCTNQLTGSCNIQYEVEFSVQEVPGPTAPSNPALTIGNPNFAGLGGTFISANTPMILATADPKTEGFQYRFYKQTTGTALPILPVYPSLPDFSGPVHWAHADLPSPFQFLGGVNTNVSGSTPGFIPPVGGSVGVYVGVANGGDGPYEFQYSAESYGNVLQPRQGASVVLDTTPPVATITQPAATQYAQNSMMTLSYTVSDGAGSGVQSFTPTMDGAARLPDGTSLGNGQPISLSSLSPGTHTFSVNSVDNVNNAGSNSVVFSVVQTTGDVSNLVSVVRGGYVYNFATSRYAQTVTLTNNSGVTISGPISLVLSGLSSNATLFNAAGVTKSVLPMGSPYLTTSVNLGPGQSASFTLQFTNPTKGAITYVTRVLAGPGAL